jgi:heme exporter protein C
MRRAVDFGLPILGVTGLILGGVLGLTIAPADRDMGDVYRIMYVHVPAAWAALLAVTVTFVASLVYLFKTSWRADALAESSAEVGVFFGALLIVLGSIWARPTWGVWWDWDPRLTTAAIMLFAFAGYLALRRFVDDPERRATWSAVAAIIAYVDVPILWFSVRWWRSLHQAQNTGSSTASIMTKSLMFNALAFIILYVWFVRLRYRVALSRQAEELAEPPAIEPASASTSTGGV